VEDLLLAWFEDAGRDLPWRRTRDPYAILVSEVMLQQTQVDRVVPRYLAWLERWPSPQELTAASPADAIREWQGLGYNRRALRAYPAWRDPRVDSEAFFVIDEGGDDGSCVEG
jgi:A/G-specific adenine glycosylase